MKIAYLILAHDQPKMFKRLVRVLDSPNVLFSVHIDRRVPQDEFMIDCQMGNIVFEHDRIYINHSGFTQVLAMLKLLQLTISMGEFDYYIFLSGRDYPIKSNSYILRYLTEHNGINFINFYPLVGDAEFTRNIRHYFFVDELAGLPPVFRKPIKICLELSNMVLPDRKFINGMIPYRGSTSWCLTGASAKYISDFAASKNNRKLVNFFRRVYGPDEIFFQTLILNSPFASQCRFYVRDVLEAINPLKNENKAYLHYIDWSKNREDPALLDISDYERIRRSEALFARKFDKYKSKKLLDQIDSHLL